jgi:hypothetical protein
MVWISNRVTTRTASATISRAAAFLTLIPSQLVAGGPKYVAGVNFFNPGVVGQPVRWPSGLVRYFVDQGPLNAMVDHQQATTMVDAAAAEWSAVPTAGVSLTDAGLLNEDVSGSNIVVAGQHISQPSDVAPTATSTPVGVIFDADGSVINALFGATASDPGSCQNDGVWVWLDNIQPDATIAHGIIMLNGLCANTSDQLTMMSFQIERAFGRILGLDYAQVNPGALTSDDPGGALGWPVMQPLSGACGSAGGNCIPAPATPRFDDIAALNRIYPITASNLASFPGKETTADHTVSITGTLNFRDGAGMQGVNVVARPLDANGNPLNEFTVTFVSGGYFNGKHGNPMTGWTDLNGDPLTRWGSNDPSLQGYFDLRFMPLPPGVDAANYQITFEPINPLYILANAVGPYVDGSPMPSGTMPTLSVEGLSAGTTQTLAVTIHDSAAAGPMDAIGTESQPRLLPPSGLWSGRISQVEQTDWFVFPVRSGHTFTLVTQALDESGIPTENKAMPVLGVWDALDPIGSPSVGFAPGLNGTATGESWLRVAASADDLVRIGIADMRGDGRPDYAYNGWVLYADTILPTHLPPAGGPVVIRGMGFRPSDTVLIGGQPATITSISPNEITAIAPPAAQGLSGSVDVEIDDLPSFYAAAIISGGISYDAGTGDSLTLLTAPSNTVPLGVPLPFSVTALTANLTPAGGVTVLFSLSSGTAMLGCGQPRCVVVATEDGQATLLVTPTSAAPAVVTASLTNGSSLQAHFTGGNPPVLSALTPQVSVAAGATIGWTTQALALSNGVPLEGQVVVWQPAAGITMQSSTPVVTGSDGIAAKTLTVGPLAEGQQSTANACVNGTTQCVQFNAIGARPEYAWLEAVSGTTQSIPTNSSPTQIVLRVRDMNGNPMAGATVTFFQSLYAWAPPCPPHGRCAASPLLATQVSTATSTLDGTVVFTPASIPGTPTSLVGLAATGNSSTLPVALERFP